MNRTGIPSNEWLRRIADLFDEAAYGMTPDEIDQELRDAGWDPDEVGRKMAEHARRTLEAMKPGDGGG